MMSPNRTTWRLPLGTLLLTAGLALSVTSAEEPGSTPAGPARTVRVATVSTAGTTTAVRFPGVLRAAERADLAFSLSARLASRPVEPGQRVAAGTIVATLDDREVRHAVEAADAGLADVRARHAQAASERRRVARLLEARAATSEELEQVEARAEALAASTRLAETRLRDARRLLGEAMLRAPFNGTVTATHHEPGEFVAAGRPVVTLSGGGGLEVEVRLPERVVPALAEGAAVRVELPMAGGAAEGTLRRVGRAAGSGGLYPVVVALAPAPGLLPGMAAEAVFELAAEDQLTVPLRAILNPGSSRPRVFRVDGRRVRAVAVEVGSLVGDQVAVSGALEAGDEVVIHGHTALIDGDEVEVAR